MKNKKSLNILLVLAMMIVCSFGVNATEYGQYIWEYFSFDNDGDETQVEGLNSNIIVDTMWGDNYTINNTFSQSGGSLQCNAVNQLSNPNGWHIDDQEENYDRLRTIWTFFNHSSWAVCSWNYADQKYDDSGRAKTILQARELVSNTYHDFDTTSQKYDGTHAYVYDSDGNSNVIWTNNDPSISLNQWHFACVLRNSTHGYIKHWSADYPNGYSADSNEISPGIRTFDDWERKDFGIMTSGYQYAGYHGFMDDMYFISTDDNALIQSIYEGNFTGKSEGVGITPIISDINFDYLGSEIATISWDTSSYTNSTIYYRKQGESTWLPVHNSSTTKSHVLGVASLIASTIYEYNISSCNINNVCNMTQTDTFTTTTYKFDVDEIYYEWDKFSNTPGDTININATINPDNTATNSVNVSFFLNDTNICNDLIIVSGGNNVVANCSYITKDETNLIRVVTNYSGSNEKRRMAIFKNHPYYFDVDYEEQKEIISDPNGYIYPYYQQFVSHCEDMKTYSAAPTGYWRGNLFVDFGLCYQLYEENQTYIDTAVENINFWCGIDFDTYNDWLHDTVALYGRISEVYDMLANNMSVEQRTNITTCLYKYADWSLDGSHPEDTEGRISTGRYPFSPGNGQGIETGRSEHAPIIYGEHNDYNDTWLDSKDRFQWYLESTFNFLSGYKGGIYAPDGWNYRTYGMYSGYLALPMEKFYYPNKQWSKSEAIQKTICEWNDHAIYNVVKAGKDSWDYNGENFARHMDEKDSNAYDAQEPQESMMTVQYCENETRQQVALWNFNWTMNMNNKNRFSVDSSRHWLLFYRNITPMSPMDANFTNYYIDQADNGTHTGIVFYRTGFETLKQKTAEDTVIAFISSGDGTTGHNNADDNSIYIYVGGEDGGEEIFTDGGGRRAEYFDSTSLGVGQDYKGAEARHSVLILDNKRGGSWNDIGEIEPEDGAQLIEYSDRINPPSEDTSKIPGNDVGMLNCWIGNYTDGGLEENGYSGGFPSCPYFEPEYNALTRATPLENGSMHIVGNEWYWSGVSGEYLNWTRNVIIFNNSDRLFTLIYDNINNPFGGVHNYTLNWMTATNQDNLESNITQDGAGYIVENGVANGYIETIYNENDFVYDMNYMTVNKGAYQESDVYYEKISENHVDMTNDENLSAVTLIIPYTDAQGNPLAVYDSSKTGDTITTKILGSTKTYEINYSVSSPDAISYVTYETTVPFVRLVTPNDAIFHNSSTALLGCNISTPSSTLENLSLFVDGVLNQTISVSGSSVFNIFTVNDLTDDSHTWTCLGYDVEGVISNNPTPRQFVVDTIFPTITLQTISINEIRPLINLSVDENVVNLTFSEDGITYDLLCEDCNSSAITYLYLGEGVHNIYYKAEDYSGNIRSVTTALTVFLNETFEDSFSNSLYTEVHNFTNVVDDKLQFFKLNMTEYEFYQPVKDTNPEVWCAVFDATSGFQTIGTGNTDEWFNSTNFQTVSAYPPCADAVLQYNYSDTSEWWGINKDNAIANYSHVDNYVRLPFTGDYRAYASITYHHDLDHSSYAWAGTWGIDGVLGNSHYHGGDNFRSLREGNVGDGVTILQAKNTVAMQIYPNKPASVLDRIMICSGAPTPTDIFTSGVCYPVSNKTKDRNATGSFLSKQINITTDLKWVQATWNLTNGSQDDFNVKLKVGTNDWETFDNGQSIQYDTTEDKTIQYSIDYNSEITIELESFNLLWDDDGVMPTTTTTSTTEATTTTQASSGGASGGSTPTTESTTTTLSIEQKFDFDKKTILVVIIVAIVIISMFFPVILKTGIGMVQQLIRLLFALPIIPLAIIIIIALYIILKIIGVL